MEISKNFVNEFREKIVKWGKENFISYPWRKTKDPYKILIAEVLLHRTRSEQVVPLYNIFLVKYPNIHDLARAKLSELENLLFSAGLKWRVKKLHEMAKEIIIKHGGKIPHNYEELRALPGVSDYIASAVRCFAFDYPDPIIDTNTVRIIARVLGIKITDSLRRSTSLRKLLQKLIDPENPAFFNFTLLDLGKTICRAKKPECKNCPINSLCSYAKDEK